MAYSRGNSSNVVAEAEDDNEPSILLEREGASVLGFGTLNEMKQELKKQQKIKILLEEEVARLRQRTQFALKCTEQQVIAGYYPKTLMKKLNEPSIGGRHQENNGSFGQEYMVKTATLSSPPHNEQQNPQHLLGDLKKCLAERDDAIALLEKERKRNAEYQDSIRILQSKLDHHTAEQQNTTERIPPHRTADLSSGEAAGAQSTCIFRFQRQSKMACLHARRLVIHQHHSARLQQIPEQEESETESDDAENSGDSDSSTEDSSTTDRLCELECDVARLEEEKKAALERAEELDAVVTHLDAELKAVMIECEEMRRQNTTGKQVTDDTAMLCEISTLQQQSEVLKHNFDELSKENMRLRETVTSNRKQLARATTQLELLRSKVQDRSPCSALKQLESMFRSRQAALALAESALKELRISACKIEQLEIQISTLHGIDRNRVPERMCPSDENGGEVAISKTSCQIRHHNSEQTVPANHTEAHYIAYTHFGPNAVVQTMLENDRFGVSSAYTTMGYKDSALSYGSHSPATSDSGVYAESIIDRTAELSLADSKSSNATTAVALTTESEVQNTETILRDEFTMDTSEIRQHLCAAIDAADRVMLKHSGPIPRVIEPRGPEMLDVSRSVFEVNADAVSQTSSLGSLSDISRFTNSASQRIAAYTEEEVRRLVEESESLRRDVADLRQGLILQYGWVSEEKLLEAQTENETLRMRVSELEEVEMRMKRLVQENETERTVWCVEEAGADNVLPTTLVLQEATRQLNSQDSTTKGNTLLIKSTSAQTEAISSVIERAVQTECSRGDDELSIQLRSAYDVNSALSAELDFVNAELSQARGYLQQWNEFYYQYSFDLQLNVEANVGRIPFQNESNCNTLSSSIDPQLSQQPVDKEEASSQHTSCDENSSHTTVKVPAATLPSSAEQCHHYTREHSSRKFVTSGFATKHELDTSDQHRRPLQLEGGLSSDLGNQAKVSTPPTPQVRHCPPELFSSPSNDPFVESFSAGMCLNDTASGSLGRAAHIVMRPPNSDPAYGGR